MLKGQFKKFGIFNVLLDLKLSESRVQFFDFCIFHGAYHEVVHITQMTNDLGQAT